MKGSYYISAIVLTVMLASMSGAGFVGSASINAPAVIVYNNTGSLTMITLTITNGNGNVVFTNASMVANDTLQSSEVAARYASSYSGMNFSRYNFTYTIHDGGANVSGPSAGAAMTLLGISAFEHRPLRTDFTITGTISPNGEIGQIGGALDKISAASAKGLTLVLVPWATPGSIEQGVYYIGQTEYKIPIVEVGNITQAASYAFGNATGVTNEVMINFSSQYQVVSLPKASLNCSNECNELPFGQFSNYTIGIARDQIANLSETFPAAATQLGNVTNQAEAAHAKGYFYISADIAFLNYLDAFYLSSYNSTRSQAYSLMQGIQSGCAGLVSPQLTQSNYEYIIGGELRQGWANYTINSTLSGFNATGATRDDIVSAMYSAGQSQAWCSAVSFLYDYPYTGSGAPVTFSQSLGQLAIQRINRAEPYSGMYLTLAKQAYKEGNYPVAILDADYAYSLSVSAETFSTNITSMNRASAGLAANSTYGVWATEFSKEALFYVYQSDKAKNSSTAQFYADQAYSSALLASQISNDTSQIYSSLVAAPGSPSTASGGGNSGPTVNDEYAIETLTVLNSLAMKVQRLTDIVAVALALLIGCIVLVGVLAHKVLALSAKLMKVNGSRRRRK
jgi:predicted S18 family serine protease